MDMKNKTGFDASADVTRGGGADAQVGFSNTYNIECYGPDGSLKWEEVVHNLVVNEGLDDVLNQYFKGSAYTAAHYVGLSNGTGMTIAAGDTMASHVGWTENQNYTEATREALTLGTVSGQSVDNSASKASFSINTNSQTIGGIFITTNSTKGGTTGTLYGGGAFTGGDKAVDSGDTLNVTVTLTSSSV